MKTVKKVEQPRVKVMQVRMRCPRCENKTGVLLPMGPPTCAFCGRPWFWPFVPIYKENEGWAKAFVERVEAEFKPVVKKVPVRELFEDVETVGDAYKEFVGILDPQRKLEAAQ